MLKGYIAAITNIHDYLYYSKIQMFQILLYEEVANMFLPTISNFHFNDKFLEFGTDLCLIVISI